MKQVIIEQTGPPADVVQLREVPSPAVAPGQVRLRMLHAPVNPADLNYMEGTYGKKPVLPAVPGIEGVGRIVETGDGVDGLRTGRLAILIGGIGCWAEEIVRPATEIFALPEGIDPRQAAMLRVNPATAWGLLHAAGELPPGAVVVQNAASSACGHCLIQVARHLGLRTVNLVRREESIAVCRELGGDMVLTDDTNTVVALRGMPGFAPPVLALNAVGGDSAVRVMDLLAPGGTMVTYGAMARQPVKVPNGFLIFKDVRLRGFWLTRWLEETPLDEVRELYGKLAALVAGGQLKQTVAAEFPLTELKEALQYAARDARGGKVLLRLE